MENQRRGQGPNRHAPGRGGRLGRHWIRTGASILLLGIVVLALPGPAVCLEQGQVTGTIERTNTQFLRDYEKMDYKGKKEWEKWGRGLKSLGWIVVQGDSGELKDYVLLVIDTRTRIEAPGCGKPGLGALQPGDRVWAKYRMGWDALHAQEVRKIK